MFEVKGYVSTELGDALIKRCEELGMTKSEYVRLLATLDISVQNYQKMITYINTLYGKIDAMHNKLNIYATPLHEGIIVKNTESLENYD